MSEFEDSIWDDGEWISWDEINQQIMHKEWRAKYPNANLALIPIFEGLLHLAQEYHDETGLHLQVYGDIGELYGAITYGIRLHKNYTQGSDGKLENDFIEVKTITPFKKNDTVEVKLSGNFSKLLVVKINNEFEIAHRLISRKSLRKNSGKKLRLHWREL